VCLGFTRMVQSKLTVVKLKQIWSYLLWYKATLAHLSAANVCHHIRKYYYCDWQTENFGRGFVIWSAHTEHRNCNFHLRAHCHIRSSLTSDVANMMACSVIGSRIDYCNSLLFRVSEQNIVDRLQHVQNKAAQMVCNASRHAPSSDLLHSLHQ